MDFHKGNRRELAEAMVQMVGDDLVVKSPLNMRLARQSVAVIEDPVEIDRAREDLVDVLYDLLTAVTDDVQDRFCVSESNMHSRNGQSPPRDPDEIIGANLISDLQTKQRPREEKKATKSKQKSLGISSH